MGDSGGQVFGKSPQGITQISAQPHSLVMIASLSTPLIMSSQREDCVAVTLSALSEPGSGPGTQ